MLSKGWQKMHGARVFQLFDKMTSHPLFVAIQIRALSWRYVSANVGCLFFHITRFPRESREKEPSEDKSRRIVQFWWNFVFGISLGYDWKKSKPGLLKRLLERATVSCVFWIQNVSNPDIIYIIRCRLLFSIYIWTWFCSIMLFTKDILKKITWESIFLHFLPFVRLI